jgi:hypothetical protein
MDWYSGGNERQSKDHGYVKISRGYSLLDMETALQYGRRSAVTGSRTHQSLTTIFTTLHFAEESEVLVILRPTPECRRHILFTKDDNPEVKSEDRLALWH